MEAIEYTERIKNDIEERTSNLKLLKEYCDNKTFDLELLGCDLCLLKNVCTPEIGSRFINMPDGLLTQVVDLIKKEYEHGESEH